jgi:hypothetical protein
MHIRRILLSIPAVLVAACMAQPAVVTAPVPAGRDVFACATDRITALGYTVETANRDARTVRGVKREGSIETTLTAAIYAEGGADQLRVTADFWSVSGTNRMQVSATPYMRADAQSVVDTCTR